MRKFILAVVFLAICPLFFAQQPQPVSQTPAVQQTLSASSVKEKPRVFITDSQSWEIRSSEGGSHGSFSGVSSGGASPQTAEIIKTFGQRCPDVLVNNKQELADYIVVLDHEGGKGYLQHKNKVAVFERVSGDVLVSRSTLSLGGSVEEACNGIAQHWNTHSKEILAAKGKAVIVPPVPATTAPVVASVTTPLSIQASLAIDSTPSGADIEIDGEFVGNTPSTVTVAPGSHRIAVKKKGYADWGKTMNITGGTIHLNAELEQVQSQPPVAIPPPPPPAN
jgi:hypothetical protein